MRVSCPSCQTEYDVPDAALAGRTRKLRCANCGNQWLAGPAPEGNAADFPPQFAPPPAPLPPAPPAAPPPAPPPENWASPAPAAAYQPAAAPGVNSPEADAPEADGLRTLPEQPYQSPYIAPARPAPPDPAEARSIADRESFAALLESSRQAGAQQPDESETKRNRKRPSPWLISILLLLLIAGLAVLERGHIMQAWPPSIRLFQALGLGK